MTNKTMEIKDLKKLFGKYDLYTLDSIGFLLGLGKNYDKKTNIAFDSIYQRKYDLEKDNMEGRNEYDILTIMQNFDLSEINDNIDNLTPSELEYIHGIVDKALIGIKKRKIAEDHIISDLEKFLNKYSERVLNYSNLPTLDDNFTDDEIREFFNKYSFNELNAMGLLFLYLFDTNICRLSELYNEVLEDKKMEFYSKKGTIITPIGYKVSILSKKNELLNYKELELLGKITESSSMCLDSVKDHIDAYDEYKEVSILNDSIEKEINKRKTNTKTFKITKIKKAH